MNTYYCTFTRAEIEAILAHGFTDNIRATKSNRAAGVYIADVAQGRPDTDDQLLEIKLPEVIDLSGWQLVLPPDCSVAYDEWIVPSSILNAHAKLRLVTKEEWEQLYAKEEKARSDRLVAATEELVARGFLEQAKDAHGRLLYEKGQPVWTVTAKGVAAYEAGEEPFEAGERAGP
jgi:hypothetical protein